MSNEKGLPLGVAVLERGWLSSNSILCTGRNRTALVDSGYSTHATQTTALIQQCLDGRPLDWLLNTHLHSDHCGGNAVLQKHYPHLHTAIPSGLSQHVTQWDPVALSYVPTGQQCAPFTFQSLLKPDTEIELADWMWQIHSAPGHDPDAVILFEPQSATLISGDALWQNGFGVVFPELQGEPGFAEVEATLDLIARLQPNIVIPGHGPVFSNTHEALLRARQRLDGFVRNPAKHALHAGKVLLKFKLLELQRVAFDDLRSWALHTPYFQLMHQSCFPESTIDDWMLRLLQELEHSGAVRRNGGDVLNV